MSQAMGSRLCSMPPELLGEIFSDLTQLDPDAPFALRSVCRTFYNVVRRTPKIWTHLKLDISPDSVYYCLAKSQVWFSMAGDCKVWVEAELHPGQATKDIGAHDLSTSWHNIPYHLSAYAGQINTLTLHSATVDEAQIFLSSLYAETTQVPTGHPLQSLSLIATPEVASHRHPRSKAMSPITLPTFPLLRHLTLTNHLLPYLSIINSQNLQSLSLTYPLRFPPLSIFDLRHALRSCSQLVRLEVEARITDAPNSSAFPSESDAEGSSEGEPADPDASSQSSSQSSLISLPNLTHLQLRINNLPLLLGDLLVQNLDTLKIEDLDGKRARADAETGAMLRQLLVRMELPSEDKRGQGNGCGSGSSSSDAFGTWAWCLHRMRSLKELRVSKVNLKFLLALIIVRVIPTGNGRR
ncbi:hypothetical protein BJ165DRAFT_123307 [Panaeolus papilionaceus]|nr:hypothetical protein BJ165DRAFT_123307 [Panaeolus papilionaceus]